MASDRSVDDALQELAKLLQVQPSSEFSRGVHQRLVAQDIRSNSFWRLLTIVTGVALFVGVGWVMSDRNRTQRVEQTSAAHSAVALEAHANTDAAGAVRVPLASHVPGRTRGPQARARPSPEVLVSADQRLAFEQLRRGLADGTLSVDALPAARITVNSSLGAPTPDGHEQPDSALPGKNDDRNHLYFTSGD